MFLKMTRGLTYALLKPSRIVTETSRTVIDHLVVHFTKYTKCKTRYEINKATRCRNSTNLFVHQQRFQSVDVIMIN